MEQQAKRTDAAVQSAAKSSKLLQGATATAAGVAAGAYTLAQPVKRTMDYDLRLAHMANTAFSDKDVAGRRAGMSDLDNAIKAAVRAGGGTRDSAADALDTMIGSGALTAAESKSKLLDVMKASTAYNASGEELAGIAIRAKQTFGIDDTRAVFDMAGAAGQAGGFELKDMAKWLPSQMAAARSLGMSGERDFAKLVSANQASAITAGSKDEAGNNLVNLLAKINSQDTSKDFAKLGYDLTGSLALHRARGEDSLTAFVGFVDKIAAKDKRFTDLKAKAAATTGDEQKAALQGQVEILQSSAVGQVIQDRQALMALVGQMNNRQYGDTVRDKALASRWSADKPGATDTNFDVIGGTASFKTTRLSNEKAFAEQDAMGGFNNALGDAADKLADYAQQYPGLSTATVAATTALTTLAAAAGAAGLASTVMGGGKDGAKGGWLKSIGGFVSKLVGGGGGAAAAGFTSSPAAMLAGAGAAGYGIGTLAYDYGLSGTPMADAYARGGSRVLAAFGNKDAQYNVEHGAPVDTASLLSRVAQHLPGVGLAMQVSQAALGKASAGPAAPPAPEGRLVIEVQGPGVVKDMSATGMELNAKGGAPNARAGAHFQGG
ncbi:phage tail tape measure protein [Methylogaea oryzae]|nr:phage tail tape measure protein [Methylogaea oryzae]